MKQVKLFDDYLNMAAAQQNMSREEYTATYLVPEKRTGINKYSPMSYAEMVLDGEMDLIPAAKESGMGIAALITLIQKIDKKFKWALAESEIESLTEAERDTLAELNEMTLGQLERIEDYAEMISDRMEAGQQLESWMFSQITGALDNLNAVHDSMDGTDGIEESQVNEKMKIIMRSILNKMIPAAFGASSNPKMRDEMKIAVQSAIEPILTKYDYVVESKESDALAKDINYAMIKIDDSMSYKDFADAVATILRDEYGKHNYMPFIEELKNKL